MNTKQIEEIKLSIKEIKRKLKDVSLTKERRTRLETEVCILKRELRDINK